MKNTNRIIQFLIATTLLTACGQGATDNHPQQLLTRRIAIFKKFTKALEPLGLVARDRKDYVKAEFLSQAQVLQELSTQPWIYFSAEGNYPPTRAKAEVWSKSSDFKQAQDTFLNAVDELVKFSGSGDMPSIALRVDAVQKSCKSCHDQFRSDTPTRQ
jgi:cytochrome c556